MRAGSRHVRSDAHYLRLTQVVVDAQAMYRAFDTRQKDKVWQGKAALDLDGVLRILRSERCEFGGNWLPRSASAIAACIDACARVIYWKWDDELCRLAVEDPSALLAANLCPLSYRQWKQARRSSIHGEPELSSAHFSEAYLHDELAFFLRAPRALMFMLIYCRVLRLFGLGLSIWEVMLYNAIRCYHALSAHHSNLCVVMHYNATRWCHALQCNTVNMLLSESAARCYGITKQSRFTILDYVVKQERSTVLLLR